MDDRERILTTLVTHLTMTINRLRLARRPEDWPNDLLASVVNVNDDYSNVEAGDIVLAHTSFARGPHQWCVSRYVEPLGKGMMSGALVQDLADPDKLCHFSNESFLKIEVDTSRHYYLTGQQYKFYEKARKSFYFYDEHWGHRFGGVDFDKADPKLATIYIRPAFGGLPKGEQRLMMPVCWPVAIRFNSRTTIRAITKTLKSNGWGSDKAFEWEPCIKTAQKEVSSRISEVLFAHGWAYRAWNHPLRIQLEALLIKSAKATPSELKTTEMASIPQRIIDWCLLRKLYKELEPLAKASQDDRAQQKQNQKR
jgi:hypothetical protein